MKYKKTSETYKNGHRRKVIYNVFPTVTLRLKKTEVVDLKYIFLLKETG